MGRFITELYNEFGGLKDSKIGNTEADKSLEIGKYFIVGCMPNKGIYKRYPANIFVSEVETDKNKGLIVAARAYDDNFPQWAYNLHLCEEPTIEEIYKFTGEFIHNNPEKVMSSYTPIRRFEDKTTLDEVLVEKALVDEEIRKFILRIK